MERVLAVYKTRIFRFKPLRSNSVCHKNVVWTFCSKVGVYFMEEKTTKYKFFMVSVTGGQEEHISRIVELKIKSSNDDIRIKSLFVPPSIKGVIVVEAYSYTDVLKAFEDLKHFKRVIPGLLSEEDVKILLEIEKEEEVIDIGDTVEIVSGPFKGMTAKIINIRGEKDRREAVIQLKDASISPIPIIISVSNLKKKHESR